MRALINDGQIVQALRQMELLEKSRPDDPTLQLQIGEILQELAASRAERLQALAPDSAQAHELIGKQDEAHQKLLDALTEYKLAAKNAPRLSGVHFLIGNVYWRLGEFAAAKSALEQELQLNPNHALANLRMGQVLLRGDETNPQFAIPYLRKAILNSPTNLQAHRELGKALRLAGHQQQALQELKLVAQHLPDDNTVHAQLAAVYRALGDSASARREMELHVKILQKEHARSVAIRE